MRQLRLRHRQRIEAFAQQLNLTSLGHQVPSEQLMERSAGRSSSPLLSSYVRTAKDFASGANSFAQ